MIWLRELEKSLLLNFKGDYKFREPLSKHTTFRIGGRCSFWLEPKDLEDLKFILKLVREKRIPLFVIGEGSNTLVRDRNFKGIFIHLDSPYFKRIEFKENRILAGSGVKLKGLISACLKRRLGGLEFLAGIPGSLGGSLIMNAGVREGKRNYFMGKLVEKVEVMDLNGNKRFLKKRDLRFGYRESNLSKYIILSAEIKLKKKKKRDILDKIKKFLKYRKETQDLSFPSAGCIFKNPKSLSAGKLIEGCGLKGKRMGGAKVSCKHANFILNIKRAKARDVLRLMRFIQKKVYEKYRVYLSPEIKIV